MTTGSRLKVANLTEEELAKVHALEEAMGTLVLAFERTHQLADLTPAQVEKLRALEEEMGVFLLAYEKTDA